MKLEEMKGLVCDRAAYFTGLSDALWEIPELSYQEFCSAEMQCQALEKMGFHMERGLAGIDTAFSASFGHGHPVVGILGEFDALPGLSQRANVTEKCPVEEGGAGHGCGHNLLGVGGMAAAAAVKDYLERHEGLSGTIIYFGCPAEEGGNGKVFMLKAGCFADVDACFAWHPQDKSLYDQQISAMAQLRFQFYGVAAHTGAPYLGRSAMDAVELMNVAANYLRGRVTPDVRINYVLMNAGNRAGNIVPSSAAVRYHVRADHIGTLKEVCRRIEGIARGAALMTETSVESRVVSCSTDIQNNPTLVSIVKEAMDALLPMELTEEELAYASRFKAVGERSLALETETLAAKYGADPARPVGDFPMPGSELGCRAGSDVGDVSWSVPTVLFNLAAYAAGTNYHTWQMAAQGKSGIAHKAMLTAAVITAASAVRLMEEPDLMRRAVGELQEAQTGRDYESLISEGVRPGDAFAE